MFFIQKKWGDVSPKISTALLVLGSSALMTTSASAEAGSLVSETPIYFPMAHIVTFLFLMLGPVKIIGPFVTVTAGADRTLEKQIARNAIIFAGIALLIAGLLGEMILKKHSVPLSVLALAAGIILFLVAIQDTVRHFAFSAQEPPKQPVSQPKIKLALDPLAFPVIVTPYGIAALIVFLSFASDTEVRLQIGMIVALILVLDFLAMLFARKVLASMGIVLAILGAVLSVVQVALGLQIIHQSLLSLGVL